MKRRYTDTKNEKERKQLVDTRPRVGPGPSPEEASQIELDFLINQLFVKRLLGYVIPITQHPLLLEGIARQIRESPPAQAYLEEWIQQTAAIQKALQTLRDVSCKTTS